METQKAIPRSERLEKAKVLIEQLHEEMEAQTDNLSEELRNGNKARKLNETLSILRQILDLMEKIEFPAAP
jgi:predicted Holliday junction resolvase-like endonuclease